MAVMDAHINNSSSMPSLRRLQTECLHLLFMADTFRCKVIVHEHGD